MKTAMLDTSLEAWHELWHRLGHAQQRVYWLIRATTDTGFDMTNMEIAHALGWSINRVTGRTKELRDAGLVEAACRRACGVTGHPAYAWRTRR